MKEENTISNEQLNEQIPLGKDAFRRHQRDLPFGEKMKIAFSLAERDRIIRRAVLLPKNVKNKDIF